MFLLASGLFLLFLLVLWVDGLSHSQALGDQL